MGENGSLTGDAFIFPKSVMVVALGWLIPSPVHLFRAYTGFLYLSFLHPFCPR